MEITNDCLKLRWRYFLGFMVWIFCIDFAQAQELKTVSQCYSETGFSFISMYCGYNQAIHIEAAAHGTHPNTRIRHCGRLHGDCVIDSLDRYEWSTCEGRHSCVHNIRYVDMGNCKSKSDTGFDNHVRYEFGDEASNPIDRKTESTNHIQYLEVKYSCRPVENKQVTIPTTVREARKETETVLRREMCKNHTGQASSFTLQNPGYPDHYLANIDCRCVIQAPEGTKVTVDFKDMSLLKREESCIDWLLLKSPGHTDSTIVACGTLGGKQRTIESKSNWLLMHFHTSRDHLVDHARHNKHYAGFQIQINGESNHKFKMKCYTVDPSYIENLTSDSQEDALSSLVLPASNWDAISKPSAHTSSASSHNYRMGTVLILLISIYLAAS